MPGWKKLLPATAAMLALAGCAGDANTYDLPLTELRDRLSGERMTYHHKGKPSHLAIKVHGNSLMVTIDSPESYLHTECIVMLEAVDEARTRLVPDCGDSHNEHRQESFRAVEDNIAEKIRIILLGEGAAAPGAK